MPPTIQSLGIDQLPREQRIALVLDIWDTIAAESGQSLLTDAQRRELERRIAEDDASPDDVIPWKRVKEDANREGVETKPRGNHDSGEF